MEITEVRIHLCNEDKLKAFATVTFDNCFVVRNMKVISAGTKGFILCMPSRKHKDGSYKDIAHPIDMRFRKLLEDKVFACYEQELQKPSAPDSRVV